jgi:hypothetical protein
LDDDSLIVAACVSLGLLIRSDGSPFGYKPIAFDAWLISCCLVETPLHGGTLPSSTPGFSRSEPDCEEKACADAG